MVTDKKIKMETLVVVALICFFGGLFLAVGVTDSTQQAHLISYNHSLESYKSLNEAYGIELNKTTKKYEDLADRFNIIYRENKLLRLENQNAGLICNNTILKLHYNYAVGLN